MEQYADGLTKLVARLRADLKAPELKWYIAEVSEKGIWGMDHRDNLGILRQQQEQVLKADPLLRWVPTSHLAFEVMESGQPHYHFGPELSFGARLRKSLDPEFGGAIVKFTHSGAQGPDWFSSGSPESHRNFIRSSSASSVLLRMI